MDVERVQASLHAAELCLAHGLWDSAVNRAYFALFQAAICALERRGMRRREWTHKGVLVTLCSSLYADGNSSPPALLGPCPV